jgi:hypothetical protein
VPSNRATIGPSWAWYSLSNAMTSSGSARSAKDVNQRVGFIVTNLARPAERAVAFYNQRGTAEQWIRGQGRD